MEDPNDPDDLAMLALEARTIWGAAGSGLGADTIAVLALAYDGRRLRLDGVAEVAPGSPMSTSAARSWLLDPGVTSAPPSETRSKAIRETRRVGTGEPVPDGLRMVADDADVRPPSGWSATDWADLRSGLLGSWIGLAAEDRVVSLAHCARLTEEATEVGVETESAWRGRGLAGWTVRAWTHRLRGTGRAMFYSALEDNAASHRVATAAGGRPLGRLVRVATVRSARAAPGSPPLR